MSIRSVIHCSLLAFANLLTGCIPDENPIAPFDRGGVEHSTVTLGPEYGTQSYFDLESQSIIQSNSLTSWDIAFESTDSSHRVILNTGRAMAAASTGSTNFDSTYSPKDVTWQYDTPDGDLETIAIGIWWKNDADSIQSKQGVYVIDMGYDEKAKHQGYRKLVIESYSNGTYTIRYAGLNGANEARLEIAKDAGCMFTYASLLTGSVVQSEPLLSTGWDLLFTRYTHIFYNPSLTPYLVTGVLLNLVNTTVAIDSVRAFGDVMTEHLTEYTFTTKRDGIGYDWKYYDLEEGVYTVDPSIIYIIRTSDGFYYKLHFTDFYDQSGQKGTPTFEFQKL